MAGVFKSLDKSDVRITPFRTHKLWPETIESITNIDTASYSPNTQYLNYLSFPYRHRKDGGPRYYFTDADGALVSYGPSNNQIRGVTLEPLVLDVGYLTAIQVYGQNASTSKSNQFIGGNPAYYPTDIRLYSYTTDCTLNNFVSIPSLMQVTASGQQESVTHITYHGHGTSMVNTATTYICTTGRFLYAQVNESHSLQHLTPIKTYEDGGFINFSFLGCVAKSNTQAFVVSYDRPNQQFILQQTSNAANLDSTVLASIPYTNQLLGWSWNEDLRIKELHCEWVGSAGTTTLFTLKNISDTTSNVASPLFAMCSSNGGSGVILNDNFVKILSDTSYWDSYGFRVQTSKKLYGVTSEGFIYKNISYKNNTLTYDSVLDLRQYVGAGNQVVNATITMDNDAFGNSKTPVVITMLVRPTWSISTGSHIGPHQLVTINVLTNEVYDPIHLGSTGPAYLYNIPNPIEGSYTGYGSSTNKQGNLISSGSAAIVLGGQGLLDLGTSDFEVKLHTFNPNI